MKKRAVITKICWLSPAEGGRERPPAGPQYSTVARFENAAENWPQEAWSILAEFIEESKGSRSVLAALRFLSPLAPSQLLEPGSKFDLFEGRRRVAHGEVLEALPQIRKNRSALQMQD